MMITPRLGAVGLLHRRPAKLRAELPADMALIGTGYSYLQEYLPHVATAIIREGGADVIGLGRMTLSYPHLPADILEKGTLEKRNICRTFSDCTTAPRNGLVSGCFPLDEFYTNHTGNDQLRKIKRGETQ